MHIRKHVKAAVEDNLEADTRIEKLAAHLARVAAQNRNREVSGYLLSIAEELYAAHGDMRRVSSALEALDRTIAYYQLDITIVEG